jgi:hypothetical protein
MHVAIIADFVIISYLLFYKKGSLIEETEVTTSVKAASPHVGREKRGAAVTRSVEPS